MRVVRGGGCGTDGQCGCDVQRSTATYPKLEDDEAACAATRGISKYSVITRASM